MTEVSARLLEYCQTPRQREVVEAMIALGSTDLAAETVGIKTRQVQRIVREIMLRSATQKSKREVEVPKLPASIDVSALVEERKRKYGLKAQSEEARRLIDAQVKIPGPIGILFFGDPHVDDDGADLVALERHARLVRNTPGLFGANVGDSTNNWVGRLGHLYSEQSTSAVEAWALCEWFIREVGDWLFLLSGNHDAWSGAGDPLKWICRQGNNLYETNVRMRLNFPNKRHVTVNARHDFSGHSMWNPAHGVGRSIQQGLWDDIAVCGHRHVTGYMPLKSPVDQRVCHALQVASYKIWDRYARDKGFRDQNISPAMVTIIDPDKAPENPSRVTVYLDPDEGVEFLAWKRRQHGG